MWISKSGGNGIISLIFNFFGFLILEVMRFSKSISGVGLLSSLDCNEGSFNEGISKMGLFGGVLYSSVVGFSKVEIGLLNEAQTVTEWMLDEAIF